METIGKPFEKPMQNQLRQQHGGLGEGGLLVTVCCDGVRLVGAVAGDSRRGADVLHGRQQSTATDGAAWRSGAGAAGCTAAHGQHHPSPHRDSYVQP